MAGWIKVDRGIVNHWIYTGEPFTRFQAWMDILLTVNYQPHEFISKGKLIKLEPGQMIASINSLAKRWSWSYNKVRRFLNQLMNEQMVQTCGSPYGTTVTVVNWAKYQHQRQACERTDESPDERTDERPDESLYKKDKKDKKEKKGEKAPDGAPPMNFSDLMKEYGA